MKKILFFMFFSLLVKADYLNTKDHNHCIIDLEPKQNSSGYCYHDQNQDRDECDRNLEMRDLINGYEFKDNECVMKNDLKVTGLSQGQWNDNMIYLANILGFTMFFLTNFLAVLVVRK